MTVWLNFWTLKWSMYLICSIHNWLAVLCSLNHSIVILLISLTAVGCWRTTKEAEAVSWVRQSWHGCWGFRAKSGEKLRSHIWYDMIIGIHCRGWISYLSIYLMRFKSAWSHWRFIELLIQLDNLWEELHWLTEFEMAYNLSCVELIFACWG